MKLACVGLHSGQEEGLPSDRTREDVPLWLHVFSFRREFCAGGLMILLGLVAAVKGPGYRIGTLMHMGPGFMPTALGIILIILGIVIAGTAAASAPAEGEEGNILPPSPQWFAWLCILGGPAVFVLFGTIGGMAPATFACVFVSALGDRASTWKGSLILAAVVTLFGVLLFHFLLQIPMPVLEWRL